MSATHTASPDTYIEGYNVCESKSRNRSGNRRRPSYNSADRDQSGTNCPDTPLPAHFLSSGTYEDALGQLMQNNEAAHRA